MRTQFGGLATVLGLCLVCCGCSGQAMAPVHGKVTLEDGSPVANATVVFENSATKVSATGTTDKDGMYELMTLEAGDGAPLGKYQVTVHHPMPEDSGQVQGLRRFPPRYERPGTSGLTYEVKDSGNEYNISLKRK